MQKNSHIPIKKILNISINVFFYIVIILLLIFSIANIQVKRQDNIPNVFGVGFLSVASDSMAGSAEDNFDKGDLIFVRMINDTNRSQLSEGDIVTFFDMNIRAFNTHRIIDSFQLDGQTYFITQGDNTIEPDPPIRDMDVLSVYRSSWSGAGETLTYLQSSVGFALFIILPVFFILVYEGIVLGKNILALNKSKLEEKMLIEKEKAMSELQSQKENMKKELLEELKREQAQKNNSQ